MLIHTFAPSKLEDGKTLLMVMVIGGSLLILVLGLLSWTNTNTELTARNGEYNRAAIAAEAATEKVIASIGNDYQNFGVNLINSRLDEYRAMVPTETENSYWTDFEFADENGTLNRTTVDWLPLSTTNVLSTKYQGLRGTAFDIRIVSHARDKTGRFNIVARNRQNLELAVVGLFQYAVFYNVDLELHPAPAMVINGPVHCNGDIYVEPGSSLIFEDEITSVGTIIEGRHPDNPFSSSSGTVIFRSFHTAGVQALKLPLGTNNTLSMTRAILEVPPPSESRSSLMGQLRYYNTADLVILVRDSGITATSGAFNDFATVISPSEVDDFLKINATFFNARENRTVRSCDLDLQKLRQWNTNNVTLRSLLPHQDVRNIYIADLRSQTSTTQSGIRLINGQWLPPKGLTVATPNPAYVRGHYNVTTNGTTIITGSSNTVHTFPASIAADAVTILSENWNDTNSADNLSFRVAVDTTVNAAIFSGNVPTTTASYSGGLENFPRFLEDWDAKTFTYNGSLAAMFNSEIANAPWEGNGAPVAIYNAPIRLWSFDMNFNDLSKLPPGTPMLRALIRGAWSD